MRSEPPTRTEPSSPLAISSYTLARLTPKRARTLYRVRAEANNILDLRVDAARNQVGLSLDDLTSPVGEYNACQRVAAVAHQLEYHGVVAPAATGLGETLALFRERVSITELPVVVEQEEWSQLPPRPGTGTVRVNLVKD